MRVYHRKFKGNESPTASQEHLRALSFYNAFDDSHYSMIGRHKNYTVRFSNIEQSIQIYINENISDALNIIGKLDNSSMEKYTEACLYEYMLEKKYENGPDVGLDLSGDDPKVVKFKERLAEIKDNFKTVKPKIAKKIDNELSILFTPKVAA